MRDVLTSKSGDYLFILLKFKRNSSVQFSTDFHCKQCHLRFWIVHDKCTDKISNTLQCRNRKYCKMVRLWLTLLFCRSSRACSHKLSQRSNRPLSAQTAPRNTIGCATSGHFVVNMRSRIVSDSMCIELWLNRIACKSWTVWLSIQFSYAGTGATHFFLITFSGSSYLNVGESNYRSSKQIEGWFFFSI